LAGGSGKKGKFRLCRRYGKSREGKKNGDPYDTIMLRIWPWGLVTLYAWEDRTTFTVRGFLRRGGAGGAT